MKYTLETRLADFDLTTRALTTCSHMGIRTVGGLIKCDLSKLKKVRNCGKVSINELNNLRNRFISEQKEASEFLGCRVYIQTPLIKIGDRVFIPCRSEATYENNEYLIDLADVSMIRRTDTGAASLKMKDAEDKDKYHNCIYPYKTLIDELKNLELHS